MDKQLPERPETKSKSKWLILIPIGKHPLEQFNYTLENTILEHIAEEKDLRIIIDKNQNFTSIINSKVKKANQIMGIIRRSYSFLN